MDPEIFVQMWRIDFLAFLQKVFQVLRPGRDLKDNWHLKAMIRQLERCCALDNQRLIITMPPRSLKSLTVSVAWTAWQLGQNPGLKIVVVSYSEPLAEMLSTDVRKVMDSEFYRQTFPATVLTKRTSLLLETSQGGSRFATTVGGAITGFGGDWIIIDDPLNAPAAHSTALREAVNRYFDDTLSTRLDEVEEGRIVLVMQRLHDHDLVGHLIEIDNFEQLKLQACATEDAIIDLGNGQTHIVKEGDLLHAERLPQWFLDQQKRGMGSTAFQAQYQQDPIPEGGNMVKSTWPRVYDELPKVGDGQVIQSLDTASKTDPANDFSVCTTWLMKGGDHYLIDVYRERVDYPSLRRKMIHMFRQHQANHLLIEDHGAGTSLIQEMKGLGIPAVGIRPVGSKAVRMAAATVFLEAGQMWLPKHAPWLAAFQAELFGFPAVRHDDQVDSVSQYFSWVRERSSTSMFVCDWGYGPPTHDGIAYELIANKLNRFSY